ncbi:MAG: ECF-type sigma factor [Planctomycetota bacterium]|nr:ECF-type sigma factor [Planctomycetota bacterium]
MHEESAKVLLDRMARGERHSAEKLIPMVYSQLRALAQKALAGERRDHTLQATALVHEAYAKLVDQPLVGYANQAHFFHAAARAMRQVLVDHARARNAVKRGGGAAVSSISDVAAAFHADPDRVLALDEAISRLEQEDPEAASVVRLRFFAGLSGEESAAILMVSPRKVDMLWARARAKLMLLLEASD